MFRFLSIITLTIPLLVSSCYAPVTNMPPTGMYHPGDYLRPLGGAPQPPEQPGSRDNVSYWDGDGVPGAPSVNIDIGDQRAYFYKGDKLVGVSPVSTGTSSHPTPTGSYKITQKSPNHRSNLYGEIVDANGFVINKEADARTDRVPPGGKFVGASMPYFMRFAGGVGMHAGYLPGFPASHGCIRMPDKMAEIFF